MEVFIFDKHGTFIKKLKAFTQRRKIDFIFIPSGKKNFRIKNLINKARKEWFLIKIGKENIGGVFKAN